MCDIRVYSRNYFKFIVDTSNYSGKIKMRLIRQPQNSTLCGIACVAMIAENYISKSHVLWEYVIGITLFVFSLIFLIGRFIIIKKNK